MRRLILATPLAALVLTGCVIGPNLAQRMSGFVGQPEAVLVAQLGVPDRRIETGGLTYFAYVHRESHYTAGSYGYGPFFGPFYGPFNGGGFPAQAYTDSCTATFALKNKMVESFTLRGNDC